MNAKDRPSLVFAHYFGGSARSWSPLLAALGGQFDCVAPDLPGFGGAPPLSGPPGLGAYAAHVHALAPHRAWIAVGHSMGGKIALAAALRRPAGPIAAILIATSPPGPEPIDEKDRARTLASFGSKAAAEALFEAIAADSLPRDVRAACIEDELRVDRAAWRWWLEQGSRDDISGDTAGLTLPVLVLTGDRDTVMGPGTAPAVARDLQNARLETIAGGGHLVPLEKPDAVAASIADFVANVSPGPMR